MLADDVSVESLDQTEMHRHGWVRLPLWEMAICADCKPLLPMPFRAEVERDAWAAEHHEIGHEVITYREVQ